MCYDGIKRSANRRVSFAMSIRRRSLSERTAPNGGYDDGAKPSGGKRIFRELLMAALFYVRRYDISGAYPRHWAEISRNCVSISGLIGISETHFAKRAKSLQ